MIVELIGAPGAGKTTMVPVVHRGLTQAGYRADTVTRIARRVARRTRAGAWIERTSPASIRPQLLWQVFLWQSFTARKSFEKSRPELIEFVRRSQARRPIVPADKRHGLFWFNRLSGYFAFLSRYLEEGEGLILDEGFSHRVVQLFGSGFEAPDESAVQRYLDLVPRPDVVIHISAPWRVCLERVYQRGLWPRFRGRPTVEVLGYFEHAHCLVGMAVAHMKRKGWPLIEVDNTGEQPENSARDLVQALAVALRAP